jgi:hypothetical protein
MRPANRSQLMEYLGAEQRNVVWSWCAVNESEQKVYLSIWTDTRKKRGDDEAPSYIIQEPDWGVNSSTQSRSAARKDHDEKLSKIFDQNYEAFGYFVVAKNTTSSPREIEETRTSFIFNLKLKKLPDGTILGYPLNRIEIR